MNVLILNSSSDLYGGCRIMSIVAETLLLDGHRPIVILSENGPLVAFLEEKGIDVRIIRLGILRRKYMNIPGLFNRIKVSRKAWSTLSTLIDQEKIDVIYSNTTSVFIGGFLAKKKRLRHVWHIHEIITKPHWFTSAIAFLLKRYGDQVIVVSDAVKNHWAKHLGQFPMQRIYNGIDVSPYLQVQSALKAELKLQNEVPVIGMIGRVNHWKGQHYFLEIANIIHQSRPDCHFVLVGDAFPGNEHLETELTKAIDQSGIPSHIHNLGYRTDIPNILRGLDIFVSPSTLPDPFPTVILEAMASAKPVIATEHGGATEMIADPETGGLIPIDDAAAAAKIMLDFLNHPAKLTLAGTKARERILNKFSLESFQGHILSLFNALH